MSELALLDTSVWARLRDGRIGGAAAEELAALPLLELDTAACRRALDAQAQLAALPGVSHRVKPIDLLVAAVAERHTTGVLHYDADYELLAGRTNLKFRSVWAVERGSIS